MIKLTNLADYAVVVTVQAAQSTDDGRLSAVGVAAATGIPAPTVAKITGLLARAGVLATQRGAGGGFRLARPAGAISVADVVEAVDGPIALTACVSAGVDAPAEPGLCSLETICTMRGPWQVINRTVRDALASVTIADLARVATPVPVSHMPADEARLAAE